MHLTTASLSHYRSQCGKNIKEKTACWFSFIMKLWLKWLSISWFHDFSFSFLLKLQATSGAPHTQSYHRNHDVCRNHSKLLTLLAQVNITSTSETRESGSEPVFFYFEIILLIPRNKMYSIKYTSEVIYVQSSLSENVLLVYSCSSSEHP